MSRLSRNSRALTGAAVAATLALSSCHSIDLSTSSGSLVVVSAFETQSEAQPAVARKMEDGLAAALNQGPCLKARTSRQGATLGAAYILNGSVYAEGERAFIALRLVDARTARTVWLENYDYRGISAGMMADDILRYLHDATDHLTADCGRTNTRASRFF